MGDAKGTLHIYAQGSFHERAYIVGTPEALEALRGAIDLALSKGKGTSASFVNDGEGFDTVVIQVDPETAKKLAVPYSNDYASENDASALWPWKIAES